MSGDTENIKSFLVKLGFQTDEAALEKFEKGIAQATKVVFELAEVVTAAAVAVAVGIDRWASGLEKLYYSSLRTGSSATNFHAMTRAMQSFGVSADSTAASLAGLFRYLHSNQGGPGVLDGWLRQVGKSAYDSNGNLRETSDLLADLGLFFAKQTKDGNGALNYQYDSQVGVSDDYMLASQDPGVQEKITQEKQRMQRAGFKHATEGARQFMNQMRDLGDELMIFGVRVVDVLQKKLGVSVNTLTDWFEKHGDKLADRIAAVVGALMNDFNKVLSWLDEHGPQIAQMIEDAFGQIAKTYELIKPALSWVFDRFVALDEVTGGWSTKLLILLAVLEKIGAVSIASGALGLLFGKVGGGVVGFLGWPLTLLTAALAGLGYGVYKLEQATEEDIKTLPAHSETRAGAALQRGMDHLTWGGAGTVITDQLQDLGYTRAESIGMLANFQAESGLDYESGHIDTDGKEHRGLLSWSPDRQNKFELWAGHPMWGSTRKEQVAFAAAEMQEGEPWSDPGAIRAHKLMTQHPDEATYAAEVYSRLAVRPADADGQARRRGEMADHIIHQSYTIRIDGSVSPEMTAKALTDRLKAENQEMFRNMKVPSF